MNDKIERDLFYSVGVINYFKNNFLTNNDKSQKYISNLEKILDLKEDESTYFLDSIKEKTDNLDTSFIPAIPTTKQLNYLNTINSKNLDKPFENEMNRIRKITCKLNKSSDISEANDLVFKLSSFSFCHLVDAKHDIFETVKLTEDVFYYLNFINYFFPTLEEEINKIKELYFSLFYSYIVWNYFADEDCDDFDIVSLIMDFNLEDIDSLLGLLNRLYPTSFVEDLLNKLEAEQDMELNSGLTIDGVNKFFGVGSDDGEGYYLQFLLMSNGGIFRDNYESLYKMFMPCDISNMYLNEAVVAQYNNKKSQSKMLLKHVAKDKLYGANIPVYEELEAALAAPGRKLFKSKDFSSEVATLLLSDDKNLFPKILEDLNTPLTTICIQNMVSDILDDVRFVANDIEFLLNYSPVIVRVYLLKPSKFILKKNISELYKMSVILLNINMLDESRMLINKLLEMSCNDDDLFNDDELRILENQLKLVELSLGYK